MRFEPATAHELLAGCDVLLDGTDNFDTRFHANDEAVKRRIPLVHGAALGWTGQLATILPGRSACLRCFFEGPPPPGALPTCAEAGVLAPLCGLVGAAMARAAIAVLSGKPEAGVLHRWDALRGTDRPLALKRDPSCAAFYRSLQAYEDTLANGDTTMVLSPDSAFFKYFDRGPSGRR